MIVGLLGCYFAQYQLGRTQANKRGNGCFRLGKDSVLVYVKFPLLLIGSGEISSRF